MQYRTEPEVGWPAVGSPHPALHAFQAAWQQHSGWKDPAQIDSPTPEARARVTGVPARPGAPSRGTPDVSSQAPRVPGDMGSRFALSEFAAIAALLEAISFRSKILAAASPPQSNMQRPTPTPRSPRWPKIEAPPDTGVGHKTHVLARFLHGLHGRLNGTLALILFLLADKDEGWHLQTIGQDAKPEWAKKRIGQTVSQAMDYEQATPCS